MDRKRVYLTLNPDLRAKIDTMAANEGVATSTLCTQIIQDYCEGNESEYKRLEQGNRQIFKEVRQYNIALSAIGIFLNEIFVFLLGQKQFADLSDSERQAAIDVIKRYYKPFIEASVVQGTGVTEEIVESIEAAAKYKEASQSNRKPLHGAAVTKAIAIVFPERPEESKGEGNRK